MGLYECENQSIVLWVVVNLGLEHPSLSCCQEVVGSGGAVVCLSENLCAWPSGPTWWEPPALSRSRPEVGPLSHPLEFMGLIAHRDRMMASGWWNEADSKATAHSCSV